LSEDGRTLYASNSDSLFSWGYDPATERNTSAPRTLVTGMANSDHTTRTLLRSRSVDGRMIVSRGSTSNLDLLAEDINSGHSQLKAFELGNDNSVAQFQTDGVLLGWGLRNSVGVAEHPVTGGIFSVENSVDQMQRDDVDIHENNPGEEMNFHGFLNGTRYAGQGQNCRFLHSFLPSLTDSIHQMGIPTAMRHGTLARSPTTRASEQARSSPSVIRTRQSTTLHAETTMSRRS
jgi:hypothetical protein